MYNPERVRTHPDQLAIIMGATGETVTYAEYEVRCNRLAHFFRAQGLRRGDHVAIFMDNSPRFLEVAGAAERCGLYHTPVNFNLNSGELAYIVNDCEARVLISSDLNQSVVTGAAPECARVERFLMCSSDAPPAPFESYEDVLDRFPTNPIADEQAGSAMLYSSGTTGRPKGIVRPLPAGDPSIIPSRPYNAVLFGFRPEMVYLSSGPLYHGAPLISVALSLRVGGTAVIMERFDAEQFLVLIERYGVTHAQVVPTMFSRLLKLPKEIRQHYDIRSLETVFHGAAPCPPQVKAEMIEWLGPIVLEYYAATEANGMTFCTSQEWLDHYGTVGKPVLGELLILDEEGRPVLVGQEGIVWFRGATTFEYFNDPDKTAESRMQDAVGIASTVGDVGRVDEDGYLYLTDRRTNMIISGGVNVYPQEVENLLLTHPKVFDVAVIGVPNDDWGEEVKAVVQPRRAANPGPELEQELIAFCREHLAHFKCPRSVDFVETLPRMPTGKMLKRLVRAPYWEEHESSII